ncbi:hypothetical protein A6V36_27790 [Paraburkholderia ginsengiterrae]|uniref:Uncharacterized protein n=1 Tax=Paraburkholderia ginsengiterrae TaxID=1462993 RepID=A0A1A9NBJ9_9BURK|nr:hypothetical protein [Paraburkholderia ginsengiterrae]OAJ59444.1 hypothetical protein A6V36_27790 [Paraburkholderia ginsengiterrae]OAJ63357.1 hypothetical protein A6V37_20940 [Paraburkholderia ginsengiterrae]
MNAVESVVQAVLYEGYMLYPYRPTSVKNRQRWTFGGVYPRAYAEASGSDPWVTQTECLLRGDERTRVAVRPGFLQVIERVVLDVDDAPNARPAQDRPAWRMVQRLDIDERRYSPWQEAAERHIAVPALMLGELLHEGREIPFLFEAACDLEPLADRHGTLRGALRRTRASLEGRVEVSAASVAADAFRLRVRIINETPLADAGTLKRDAASLYALVSCHTVLTIMGGEWVSSIDPPTELAAAAAACRNIGVWPVLVGNEQQPDTMLASPIILYDFPQIAPESTGDLFDATEIDEILTLRILTMTDDEKREMIATDERARELLARTESLGAEQMQKLHGTLRQLRTIDAASVGAVTPPEEPHVPVSPWAELDARPHLACVRVAGVEIRVSDQVRLRPHGRADIFDIALSGMVATIESIERDFDGHVHVAVTIDDDPGKDFGMQRMPGHRFFFAPDEIEPLVGRSGRDGNGSGNERGNGSHA